MINEEVKLWDDRDDVKLFTYILDDSQEFNTDKKRPAVIVCPGGGYLFTSDREAEPVALKFTSCGYNTFVLRYSVMEKARFPQPLFDLAKAIITIRKNSSRWFLDDKKIIICGFSAGGHIAASLGVFWKSDFLKEKFHVDSDILKPNALILGYPVTDYTELLKDWHGDLNGKKLNLSELSRKMVFGTSNPTKDQMEKASPVNFVSPETPPTFLWHTVDDSLVYVSNSLKFASRLASEKVNFELHIFGSGVHGLSLCDETTASTPDQINGHCKCWFDLAVEWLQENMSL